MKITNIVPILLRCPLAAPILTSFGLMTSRSSVLVRIDTDEGLVGYGESWTNFPHWAAEERVLTIEKGLQPLLVGEDPRRINWLWEKMYHGLMVAAGGKQYGAKGPLMQAISGVDIALWDLAGRILGVPVYQLLGGLVNTRLTAYASGLGPQGFEALVIEALGQGFTAFKLKVGFGRDQDFINLEAMRGLIDHDHLLMLDANQAWSDANQALAHLRQYVEFRPYFIEEPVSAEQIDDLKAIRAAGLLPVAGGENVYGRQGFRDCLQYMALDILQPDVTKTGGLSEARAIVQMGRAWQRPFAPHMFGTAVGLAASLHLLAALPGGLFMEVDANPNPLRTDLLKSSGFELKDGGFMVKEAGPGLGFELNQDALKEFQAKH